MSGVSENSRTHQRAEPVACEQHDRTGFAGAKQRKRIAHVSRSKDVGSLALLDAFAQHARGTEAGGHFDFCRVGKGSGDLTDGGA